MNTTASLNEVPPPPPVRYQALPPSTQDEWKVFRAVHAVSQLPISCRTWAKLMSQHPSLCYEFVMFLRDLKLTDLLLECRGSNGSSQFEFAAGPAPTLEHVEEANPGPFSQYLFQSTGIAKARNDEGNMDMDVDWTSDGQAGAGCDVSFGSWDSSSHDDDDDSSNDIGSSSEDSSATSNSTDDDSDSNVPVGSVFENLGGDAILVAPRPPSVDSGRDGRFAHLANYVKLTPLAEAGEFFSLVATEYEKMLARTHARSSADRLVYLSTNVLGVSYLHFRLEHGPKYYNYEAFKRPSVKVIEDPISLRIQVVSDLHIEFYGKESTEAPKHLIVPNAPVLALLGDIGLAFTDSLREFLHYQANQFETVIFIAGNHEFYNVGQQTRSVSEQMQWLRSVCEERDNIHLMEKESMDLCGIRILGTSLWSEIPDDTLKDAEMAMNDYARSYNHAKDEKSRNLTASETRQWHQENVRWLRDEIDTAKQEGIPTLVLTHHTPQMTGTSHPRYMRNPLTCCFSSGLTELLSFPVKVWACGHTHYNFDIDVGGTRLVSNQRGYKGEAKADYCRDGLILELEPIL